MTAIHQEQQRWRKNFDNYASLNIDGVKYLDRATFIDAIAPRSGKGHARISRDQYGVFFDVADKSNKGIVSVSISSYSLDILLSRGTSSTRHERHS